MHDPLHVCANYRREGIASIMPSPGRRKNTATAVEVQHLLKAGLPEGLGKGVTFPSENEVFCEQKELLLPGAPFDHTASHCQAGFSRMLAGIPGCRQQCGAELHSSLCR